MARFHTGFYAGGGRGRFLILVCEVVTVMCCTHATLGGLGVMPPQEILKT